MRKCIDYENQLQFKSQYISKIEPYDFYQHITYGLLKNLLPQNIAN